MKKLFDGLMEVRSQYSSMMQERGLDKWQTRETMIYKGLSTAIFLVSLKL